jgi:putative DNA primase/helicase
MLGDYGCHTPIETLLTKQYDNNIPADLARLAGARMVTAIEANFNRHLDEAKIKAMTGGEPITARFMRQNFFPFQPEFKLWFVANDRPRHRRRLLAAGPRRSPHHQDSFVRAR